MKNLRDRYEKKFNTKSSKLVIDKAWEFFVDKKIFPPSTDPDRFVHCVSILYGHVLDIGSADGYGALLMSKNPAIKTVTCLEIHDKAIAAARENLKGIDNVTIVKGIGEEIPFVDKFDSIFCGQTLEHVFDDRKVLSEIKRLLKGIAVISVPIGAKGYGPEGVHVRKYEQESFLDLIREYFEVSDVKFYPHVSIPLRGRLTVTCKII
ncbi:MAG TPA: class I SAM-dependent methyltransferase [Desulfatiglandales bacterium]|nr:class I SAM-dependent methyltransferase [Desulfatiglandales bacterium]